MPNIFTIDVVFVIKKATKNTVAFFFLSYCLTTKGLPSVFSPTHHISPEVSKAFLMYFCSSPASLMWARHRYIQECDKLFLKFFMVIYF